MHHYILYLSNDLLPCLPSLIIHIYSLYFLEQESLLFSNLPESHTQEEIQREFFKLGGSFFWGKMSKIMGTE